MRFVDTSYWVAFQLPSDGHHSAALRLWAGASYRLFTTNLVIGETWTFLRRRADNRAAVRYLDLVERSPRLNVIHVDDVIEREAWAWLRRHDERVYSFVDATSFATMRRFGLLEALAFDGDFSAAGFVEVRP